ncbi:unnamed protein product [Alopecurus aequalis]
MDDGGYVEAQPGPITDNKGAPEQEPWTWIGTTMLCLSAAVSVSAVAGGVMSLHVRPTRTDDGTTVFEWFVIALGLMVTPFVVFVAVIEFRSGRQVKAMTRLHMVPMSRP